MAALIGATPTGEKGAIVSGLGISQIGRKTGISGIDLTTASCSAAIADAGLTAADIDGISTMGETPLADVVAKFRLQPLYEGGGVTTGGLLSPAMSAFQAVTQGRARHVLVYRTVQMMGGSILSAAGAPPADAPAGEVPRSMGDMMTLLTYHAYAATNWLAMHCRRHMHLYGTTKEQLGWLAVQSRLNAARNPLAAYRDPFTLDDYLNARPISDPFGLLDCDVPIDGSVAFIVSAPEYAKDCPNKPVRVEAIGGSPGLGGWDQRADYPKMASVEAAAEMWSRTDLRPADVDLAQLYDGFTFLTFAWLEALGFCGDGESGPFVEGGTRIGPGGQLPLNTYGGQLSAGRMHGYWLLHEACLQLRGQAGERQVPNAQVAVAAAGGGPIAGCILLTA
jgi:acetyl-CoA acetyltransferase